MKNNFKTIGALLVILSVFAFKPLYEPNNATAEVIRQNGIYIFLESKPVKDYEFLGHVKEPGIVWNHEYNKMLPDLVKHALKKYPKCDALIFKSGDLGDCDAIKFK